MTESGSESQHEDAAPEETTAPQAEKKRRMPSLGSRSKSDAGSDDSGGGVGQELRATVITVRSLLAKVIWIVCVVFALLLALEVLLIAIQANPRNSLVKFDVKFTPHIDLHWFNLMNPIKDFDKKKPVNKDVKTALFNYGIAAIIWLVIGRVADAVIKPSGKAIAKSR